MANLIETERDYLFEARAILAGLSQMLPEPRHLEALEEAHQCEIIKIANDIEAMKKRVLNGA